MRRRGVGGVVTALSGECHVLHIIKVLKGQMLAPCLLLHLGVLNRTLDAQSDAKTIPKSMKNRGKCLFKTPSKILWKVHSEKLRKVSQKAPKSGA